MFRPSVSFVCLDLGNHLINIIYLLLMGRFSGSFLGLPLVYAFYLGIGLPWGGIDDL
jgi:hypothetical protein